MMRTEEPAPRPTLSELIDQLDAIREGLARIQRGLEKMEPARRDASRGPGDGRILDR